MAYRRAAISLCQTSHTAVAAVKSQFAESIDELLARFQSGDGAAWYPTDHLGSVRNILNAAGAVVDHGRSRPVCPSKNPRYRSRNSLDDAQNQHCNDGACPQDQVLCRREGV